MNRRAALAMLLALAVPGAGHFFLGRRGRALAFFAIIATLFAVGIAVDGDVYTVVESQGALLRLLASWASMGSGILYFIAKATEPHGSITAATFEYGRMFTLSAGLMNLLLVLDCYDMAIGRKTW
jgi:uncharacterized protein DUF6677